MTPNEPRWIQALVRRRWQEAADIVSLEITSADGSALPGFAAGAHIDLELPGGWVRQYSLCNPPTGLQTPAANYQIAVLLDPATRGGSRSVHESLHAGTALRISAPRNHFELVPARHSLLMAGGIGVTPLLSMAETLSREAASFEMHYCTRSAARTAFLGRLRESAFADRVHVHHDDGPASQKLDAAAALGLPREDTHLYVCGPRGFIEFVTGTARSSGWAESHIHVEHFANTAQAMPSDGGFDVRLASSGRVIRIPPDQTVTAALQKHGVMIPVSCEQGICGTCLTRVLQGEPEHRDMVLSDAEKARNDQFTPCCSRSRTPELVLDL